MQLDLFIFPEFSTVMPVLIPIAFAVLTAVFASLKLGITKKEKQMKRYKYDEWDVEDSFGGFDDRTYLDLEGNLITGVLEGFYGYTSDTGDEKNYLALT